MGVPARDGVRMLAQAMAISQKKAICHLFKAIAHPNKGYMPHQTGYMPHPKRLYATINRL
jgi:hypothetical protein